MWRWQRCLCDDSGRDRRVGLRVVLYRLGRPERRVVFSTGTVFNVNKSFVAGHVRAVRGGS